MATDRIPNKKSGSEDELGEIHYLTTQLHLLRLKEMFGLIKSGMSPEAAIGDGKAHNSAGKWASDSNGVSAKQPEMDKDSELSKNLRRIKEAQTGKGAMATGTDNVIPFDDSE